VDVLAFQRSGRDSNVVVVVAVVVAHVRDAVEAVAKEFGLHKLRNENGELRHGQQRNKNRMRRLTDI
jgi:hypothetical protein